MSHEKRRPDRLEALERWQSSELDDARIKMARLDAVASDKLAVVVRIEADIADFHSLVRKLTRGAAPLQAETLMRMNAFNHDQHKQLQNARDLHQQAKRQADEARHRVLQLFEHLCVVQRLLERRQALAGKQEQRTLQKQLDEGAMSRAPQIQNDTTAIEDTIHGS